MNFNDMDPAEIEQYIRQAQAALAERQASRRADVIDQIKSLAADAGLQVTVIDKPIRDDVPVGAKGSRVPPKFRHGDQSWSGRGIQPRWLTALVAQGRNIEDFRVAA